MKNQQSLDLEKSKANFGRRIRVLRAFIGINQTQLAARVGTTRAAISRIELGDTAVRLDTIYKIAKGLKVEPYYLFVKELPDK